ncbi:MAG: hypothetical protein ABJA70_16260 [Chryseolinea sp.]
MRVHSRNIIFITLLSVACTKALPHEESTAKPKVSVQVVQMTKGIVKDELSLTANTLYLSRNVVTAPIPAFITKVFIKLGDAVKGGQTLFVLETKERRALGSEAILPDSASTSFGKIVVKAPSSGIISTLDKQQVGDYVLEGGQLCTIAESDALAFAVNVPFEFSSFAKTGMSCSLVFPDNTVHAARFTAPLTTMNALAQTQTVLAKSNAQVFLPENLIVKVLIDKNSAKSQQVLPKACVLSDEMLQEFWVMKLENDSTAIRVPVTLGTRNHESIEILSPAFLTDSQFLITGNYGLPDTALVKVIH